MLLELQVGRNVVQQCLEVIDAVMAACSGADGRDPHHLDIGRSKHQMRMER